jgi:hypothetical protein
VEKQKKRNEQVAGFARIIVKTLPFWNRPSLGEKIKILNNLKLVTQPCRACVNGSPGKK